MKKVVKKSTKLIFLILLNCGFFNLGYAKIDSTIIASVGDQIITNYNLEQEIKYFKIIGEDGFSSLKKSEIDEIAIQSLIKEKVKLSEINNQRQFTIDKNFINLHLSTIYKNLGLNNINQFKNLLDVNNFNYDDFLNKIEIELKWNEIIYGLYSNKIQIDKKKIDKKIELIIKNNKEEEFLISEIFILAKDNAELKNKIYIVKKSIKEIGFKNTAIKYSVSDTSKNGGNLGWVSESQVTNQILKEIKKIKSGETTKPITISGGNLIIEVKNKRFTEKKIDLKKKFDEIVRAEQNHQLNGFSIFYYKRIKNNTVIKFY